MPKILSQAGTSLADVYDVEGSIAGVETLLSEDVTLVHELGQTIFSERYSGTILRAVSGDLGQNDSFSAPIVGLPTVPNRIHGIMVLVDTVSRLDDVVVVVKDTTANNDFPIWVWDETNVDTIRFIENSTLADQNVLRPLVNYTLVPNMLTGNVADGTGQSVRDIICRGNANGFGAGTVEVTVVVYVSFAASKGLSSKGLPIPSW